jgi:hypothetical protein
MAATTGMGIMAILIHPLAMILGQTIPMITAITMATRPMAMATPSLVGETKTIAPRKARRSGVRYLPNSASLSLETLLTKRGDTICSMHTLFFSSFREKSQPADLLPQKT